MGFIYDKSEYAVSTWTLEHMPLHDALDTFNNNGYKNVEIWADTVHLDPRVNPDIEKVKGWIKGYGMKVHSLHAPFRNYGDRPLDDAEFCKMRADNICKTIDFARKLDCGIVVVHPVDRGEYNYPMSQLSTVREYIERIARHAKQNGVEIAIEDIPPGASDAEIYTTLNNLKKLFAGLDIKFCLDIGHVPLLGAKVLDEVDAAGIDLITLHIHNNSGITDDHNLPGDGILDWPAIHDYIRKGGYKGEFVLEIYGGTSIESELSVIKKMNELFVK